VLETVLDVEGGGVVTVSWVVLVWVGAAEEVVLVEEVLEVVEEVLEVVDLVVPVGAAEDEVEVCVGVASGVVVVVVAAATAFAPPSMPPATDGEEDSARASRARRLLSHEA
jgi:hypothetical protein